MIIGSSAVFPAWGPRFAIPFAFYREEAALLATVAELSDAEAPIWGVDQEFFLGPQLLLDELAGRAEGPVREELEALADAEREAYRQIVESRSPAVPMFMSRPLPEPWPRILGHFAERGDEEALAIVEGLEASREIYGHFFAGRPYENNHQRARLILRGYDVVVALPGARAAELFPMPVPEPLS